MKGIELIAQERKEQIEKHGFTFEKYDRYYINSELFQAASFCLELGTKPVEMLFSWPKGWGKHFENKVRSNPPKPTGGKIAIVSKI